MNYFGSALGIDDSTLWDRFRQRWTVSYGDQWLTTAPEPLTPDVAAQARADVRARADSRAQAVNLLLSLLSDQEQARYRDKLVIRVTGSEGGVYLIQHGYSGNVYHQTGVGPTGIPVWQCLCAHPRLSGAPVESAMVAQILMIRTAELDFRQRANRM